MTMAQITNKNMICTITYITKEDIPSFFINFGEKNTDVKLTYEQFYDMYTSVLNKESFKLDCINVDIMTDGHLSFVDVYKIYFQRKFKTIRIDVDDVREFVVEILKGFKSCEKAENEIGYVETEMKS